MKSPGGGRSSRRLKRLKKLLIFAFAACALLLYLNSKGIINLPELPFNSVFRKCPEIVVPEGSAQVHYIDVGQGDCSLIISDDGSAMLIDCGEREYSGRVLGYLDSLGVRRLDYVLVSHPHSDHMGGMADIISSDIDIGTFIMPRVPDEYIPTSTVYEKMLEALEDKGCAVRALKTEDFSLGSGKIELIAPEYSGDNMNNYSAITRFTFGKNSFLFSGDAEQKIEKQILSAGYDVGADVYKAGHHGSSTSSCFDWVAAIDPDYCIIECGAGNSYGHPHEETIELLSLYTDKILRTDINGNIVFITDGESLSYETEK